MERIRVMVVDDHEVVRKHVCALLASQPDLEVTCEASDGFDAVRKAQANQPDVILLDITCLDSMGCRRPHSSRMPRPVPKYSSSASTRTHISCVKLLRSAEADT